jgi:hypothetical protein
MTSCLISNLKLPSINFSENQAVITDFTGATITISSPNGTPLISVVNGSISIKIPNVKRSRDSEYKRGSHFRQNSAEQPRTNFNPFSRFVPQNTLEHFTDILQNTVEHSTDIPQNTAEHFTDIPQNTTEHFTDIPQNPLEHFTDIPQNTSVEPTVSSQNTTNINHSPFGHHVQKNNIVQSPFDSHISSPFNKSLSQIVDEIPTYTDSLSVFQSVANHEKKSLGFFEKKGNKMSPPQPRPV